MPGAQKDEKEMQATSLLSRSAVLASICGATSKKLITAR
jgi:hypothetical protein